MVGTRSRTGAEGVGRVIGFWILLEGGADRMRDGLDLGSERGHVGLWPEQPGRGSACS